MPTLKGFLPLGVKSPVLRRNNMKKLIATIALALLMCCSAFAVDMHCTKPNNWTTVCEFSDGSVNKVSDFRDSHGRGDYYDTWYTAEEWQQYLAIVERLKYEREHPLPVPAVKSGYKTEAACVAGGFDWYDDRCHAPVLAPKQ